MEGRESHFLVERLSVPHHDGGFVLLPKLDLTSLMMKSTTT
jgi:hypothetical protein